MNRLVQNPETLSIARRFKLAEWLSDASHNFRLASQTIQHHQEYEHTSTRGFKNKIKLCPPVNLITTSRFLTSLVAAKLPNNKRNTEHNLVTQPLLKNE